MQFSLSFNVFNDVYITVDEEKFSYPYFRTSSGTTRLLKIFSKKKKRSPKLQCLVDLCVEKAKGKILNQNIPEKKK